MFPTNHDHRGSMLLSKTIQDKNNNNLDTNQGQVLYHSPYLVETTIVKHENQNDSHITNLPTYTRRHWKLYLYNAAEPNYTSISNISFYGCFKYGQAARIYRNNYPLFSSTYRRTMAKFCKELYVRRLLLKERLDYKLHLEKIV